MKADTQYSDLKGTAAADISYGFNEQKLEELADAFKIDRTKLKPVGISIGGTKDFILSFICVDIARSNGDKEHMVKVMIDEDIKDLLHTLFERLHIVFYEKFDDKYPDIDEAEEMMLSDYE